MLLFFLLLIVSFFVYFLSEFVGGFWVFFAFVCTLLFFQIWSVFKSVKSDLNINIM